MVNDPCLFCFVVLILGVDKGSPEGVGTLEMYLNVSPFAQSFEFVSSVGDVGNNNSVLNLLLLSWLLLELLLVLVLVLDVWLGCLNLSSHWLSAHFGNWQWCKAVLMCESSLSKESCVEDTVFAL